MSLDLTSVRAKLARAQEHAQTIRGEITAWHDRHAYSVQTKSKTDGSRHAVILRINEPAPFQRWTLIAADALSNMRSALDNFVYAVAVHESTPKPPSYEGKLAFPIADDKFRFDEAVSKHCLGTISQPVQAAIESFQPYNRPHKELPPLLQLLRKLNNSDKHRLLRMAYGAVQDGNVSLLGGDPSFPPKVTASAFDGEVEDGTEVLTFACDPPTPDMHFDRTEIGMAVVMWHGKRDPLGPKGSDRTEVASLLAVLHKEVRTVIYDVSARVT